VRACVPPTRRHRQRASLWRFLSSGTLSGKMHLCSPLEMPIGGNCTCAFSQAKGAYGNAQLKGTTLFGLKQERMALPLETDNVRRSVAYVRPIMEAFDGSHDWSHIERVLDHPCVDARFQEQR